MGYYDGEFDEHFNIDIDFSDLRERFREHFPHVAVADDQQGDPQEVLYNLLDQIRVELGDNFQTTGNKSSYISLIYSLVERKTTCSRCGYTSIPSKNETIFRKFNINNRVKKVQNMDALLQSISTEEEIPDYKCENCQGRHRAVSSENIVGSPKYIFFLTGIVQLVELKHFTYRKCMNFKMDLKKIIDIENNAYHLRTVISHIGDNSHLEKKTEQVGHYITYRRVEDVWYCFNDDLVDEVRFDEVGNLYLNENVYMLIYERN